MSRAPSIGLPPKLVLAVIRSTLGALFVLAGALKIAHPLTFNALLLAYSIPAPEAILHLVALFLPWLEVATGGLLLVNRWTETALPITVVLSLAFVGALAQAVLRGLDLSCGCFGGIGPEWLEKPPVALGRAVILFGLSIWLLANRQPLNPEAAA